ncbi:hypothetical protein [Paenibacillus sp. GYB003]|uniref:hypothetical protein n=1 Tax=Paenibacillus sp. GYB003 TaxID=2994392 RepID=UPI002F96DEEB
MKEVTPAHGWSVYKIVPWLKELKEYEGERFKKPLGRRTSKKTLPIVLGVLVAISFAFPPERDPRHTTLLLGDWLSIMSWLLIMAIVHWLVCKIKVDAGEAGRFKGVPSLLYILGFFSLLPIMHYRNCFEQFVIRLMS